MVYFIADTHFGEETIRRYENRPFADADAMNEEIIRKWNETVTAEDEVYVLGDFGAGGCEAELLAMLNGKKYLIKGNHDTKSNSYYRECGFEEVYDKPVILDGFWILSHEPLYVNENMPYANLFGHVHNAPMYKTYSRQHYCVSAERIAYAPISFQKIKAAIMEG